MNVSPDDQFVRVILLNAQGEMLLQLRSPQKKNYPGVWEYAAGGRRETGEQWEDAALRELQEELGIVKRAEDLKLLLEFVFYPTFCGRPLAVRIYLAQYLGEQIIPAPREVAAVRFVQPQELRKELVANPENFIPGMLMVMDQCWDKL